MLINLQTIPGTTAQEATVVVARGPEGDVESEATISYTVAQDSLTIQQETAEGGVIGLAVLSIADIEVLTNVSDSPADVASLQSRIGAGHENTAVVLHFGEDAEERLANCLESMRQDTAIGDVSVLASSQALWRKMLPEDVVYDDLLTAAVVVIDGGGTGGDCWKYTFYPESKVGVFLDEAAMPKR